jgi:hypothetical protein
MGGGVLVWLNEISQHSSKEGVCRETRKPGLYSNWVPPGYKRTMLQVYLLGTGNISMSAADTKALNTHLLE